VGNASFFQWEHRADIRNQFSIVEQLCDSPALPYA
jgi:hypothetical protein